MEGLIRRPTTLLALLALLVLTFAALAQGVALGDEDDAPEGVTAWAGNGSENLPCDGRVHWIFTAGGVDGVTLTVDGVTYGPDRQSGNGAWHFYTPAAASVQEAFATWTGDPGPGNTVLTISSCEDGGTDDGTDDGTTDDGTTDDGTADDGTDDDGTDDDGNGDDGGTDDDDGTDDDGNGDDDGTDDDGNGDDDGTDDDGTDDDGNGDDGTDVEADGEENLDDGDGAGDDGIDVEADGEENLDDGDDGPAPTRGTPGPRTEVLGVQQSRLPVTGADVPGLLLLGALMVAIGLSTVRTVRGRPND